MNLNERMKALIDATTSPSRRYKELEESTGISASTWKTYYTRGTRPSADLLESLARQFPAYCEWLLTGSLSHWRQQDPTVESATPEEPQTLDLAVLERPLSLSQQQALEVDAKRLIALSASISRRLKDKQGD
ncbi:hypothetical protein [Comamonas sp. GB3 AK4-5]|uniref:hypothetical protein n=1 Tax=Comamonas sp. GB3 AK4-5 TaxID=3231487 RepID=UPI00351E270A